MQSAKATLTEAIDRQTEAGAKKVLERVDLEKKAEDMRLKIKESAAERLLAVDRETFEKQKELNEQAAADAKDTAQRVADAWKDALAKRI